MTSNCFSRSWLILVVGSKGVGWGLFVAFEIKTDSSLSLDWAVQPIKTEEGKLSPVLHCLVCSVGAAGSGSVVICPYETSVSVYITEYCSLWCDIQVQP